MITRAKRIVFHMRKIAREHIYESICETKRVVTAVIPTSPLLELL
jgi:hypothetical protein